ncbi:MAG: hypothetical protein Q4C12_06320 [Clostridia bacterium]|nr:hypothetical protein [Clostridia bacterium]
MYKNRRFNLYKIMYSSDGQKHYYAKASEEWIEVSEAVFRLLDSTERRQQYLDSKHIRNHDVSIELLDSLLKNDSNYKLALQIADLDTPEKRLLEKETELLRLLLIRILPLCIDKLPDQDKALIKALFYSGVPVGKYAEKMGIDRKGVFTRKKRILNKLRNDLIAQLGYFVDGGDLYDE